MFAIAVLCGGFGAARWVPFLARASPSTCCIVNTADDLEYLGVHISPDVDSVCYGLAGRFDEERGWGLVGDTFECVGKLARYGEGWFRIGDEDLALALLRTVALRSGASLTEVTASSARRLGLSACVLPMSDDPVRTILHTDQGTLEFQEYLVRHRARPHVKRLEYQGIESATPAPGVLTALRTAGVVIIAPSSPLASIGPILALPGVIPTLRNREGPTIAITPVVSAQAPASPPETIRARVRAALMNSHGLDHRAADVAKLYASFAQGFVLDERDGIEAPEIERLGMNVLLADTLATPSDRSGVARSVVEFASTLRPRTLSWLASHFQ